VTFLQVSAWLGWVAINQLDVKFDSILDRCRIAGYNVVAMLLTVSNCFSEVVALRRTRGFSKRLPRVVVS